MLVRIRGFCTGPMRFASLARIHANQIDKMIKSCAPIWCYKFFFERQHRRNFWVRNFCGLQKSNISIPWKATYSEISSVEISEVLLISKFRKSGSRAFQRRLPIFHTSSGWFWESHWKFGSESNFRTFLGIPRKYGFWRQICRNSAVFGAK